MDLIFEPIAKFPRVAGLLLLAWLVLHLRYVKYLTIFESSKGVFLEIDFISRPMLDMSEGCKCKVHNSHVITF